jgi:predicted ATPase/class 3 adenylate cyclase
MTAQPTGTVTLLFSDVEGSTRLLRRLGAQRYADALGLHGRLLREAFERHGGYEVDNEGDSFFVAFAQATAAVAAASEAQETLAGAEWPGGEALPVRMGIHTGEAIAEPPKYVGLDVHLTARIMAAGHGGQVLLSQATRSLVDTPAADLGEHTLKDFDQPVRLFQLGGRRFPPLMTIANTNLVRPPTSFVARTDELAEVLTLLRSDARLVTLTGVGGTGKTRLALEAALASIGDWPNGVWFVPLAPVTDEALVEPTIAGAVGASGELRQELRSRRLLLVLDNLEQLPAAPAIVADLLAACPDLRMLATSRTRLNLSIEQEYPVSTLPPADAAELFVQRARLRKPRFEPDDSVLEIARRLDGLPLALELAAARIKVLTPAQILERLGRSLEVLGGGPADVPERQRTLQATIEWSHGLLDADEQALFRRLGVFAGSFDLEAAEAVGGGDLDTLASLVDKSLLLPAGEGRFAILHVLREYARGRLEAAGEMHSASLAHVVHYLRLVERTEPELRTSRHTEAIDRLEADRANFVRAIEWAVENEPELALDLFGKLRHLWWDRGREGWVLAQRVLAAASAGPTPAHAAALHAAAGLAWAYGDLERAVSLDEQALEIYERLDDPIRSGNALVFLGTLYQAVGRADGRETLERGLARLQAGGDEYGTTIAMGNLSHLALEDGDLATATLLSEQVVARAREHGFELIEAMATCNQAVALIHEEDPRAGATALSALRLCARTNMHLWIGNCLFVAAAAIAAEDPRRAAVLLGAAEVELQGARLAPAETAVYENATKAARSALGPIAFEQSLEEGRLLGRDAAVALALGSGDRSSDERARSLGDTVRLSGSQEENKAAH